MLLRYLRVVVGLLLGASGALMFAASWQRWTSVVCVNVPAGRWCAGLEDHYYDFLPPLPRWEQLGNGAQLAGWSLLLLTVAFVLLPWAVTGRRPGPVTTVVLLVAVLAQAAVGVATLLSGLADQVVKPVFIGLTLNAWLFVPFGVLIWFAIEARGWTRAATAALILANPLVAFFTYRFGSYDSRPWHEAISGSFIMAAGVCLLLAAAFHRTSRTPESTSTDTSTAVSPGPAPTATHRRRRAASMLPTLGGDAIVVSVAAVVALLGRETGPLVGDSTQVTGDLELVAPMLLVGWLVLIAAVGGYAAEVLGAGSDEYNRVGRATLYAAAGFGLVCYLMDYSLSRGFFLLLFGLGLPGLIVFRFALHKALHWARRRGQFAHAPLSC